MDINDLRSILTLLLFLGFNALMLLVFLRGNKAYESAANAPFAGDSDD